MEVKLELSKKSIEELEVQLLETKSILRKYEKRLSDKDEELAMAVTKLSGLESILSTIDERLQAQDMLILEKNLEVENMIIRLRISEDLIVEKDTVLDRLSKKLSESVNSNNSNSFSVCDQIQDKEDELVLNKQMCVTEESVRSQEEEIAKRIDNDKFSTESNSEAMTRCLALENRVKAVEMDRDTERAEKECATKQLEAELAMNATLSEELKAAHVCSKEKDVELEAVREELKYLNSRLLSTEKAHQMSQQYLKDLMTQLAALNNAVNDSEDAVVIGDTLKHLQDNHKYILNSYMRKHMKDPESIEQTSEDPMEQMMSTSLQSTEDSLKDKSLELEVAQKELSEMRTILTSTREMLLTRELEVRELSSEIYLANKHIQEHDHLLATALVRLQDKRVQLEAAHAEISALNQQLTSTKKEHSAFSHALNEKDLTTQEEENNALIEKGLTTQDGKTLFSSSEELIRNKDNLLDVQATIIAELTVSKTKELGPLEDLLRDREQELATCKKELTMPQGITGESTPQSPLESVTAQHQMCVFEEDTLGVHGKEVSNHGSSNTPQPTVHSEEELLGLVSSTDPAANDPIKTKDALLMAKSDTMQKIELLFDSIEQAESVVAKPRGKSERGTPGSSSKGASQPNQHSIDDRLKMKRLELESVRNDLQEFLSKLRE